MRNIAQYLVRAKISTNKVDIGILKLTLLRPTNSANLSEFLAGVVDRASLKSCELSGWILVRFRK